MSKTAKLYSSHKLPNLLRKRYSQRKFEKEIISKIFTPDDKTKIEHIFVQKALVNSDIIYVLKDDLQFTKKELHEYRFICKQIKKNQNLRVKIIPLVTVLALFTALIVGILLYKDIAVKSALKTAFEAVFGAKCDIKKVSLNLYTARLDIFELAVANKNKPMANLFEFGHISVDFDLLQLLKKKFVMNEMSIAEIRADTQRKKSGALPKKTKKALAKQKEPSAFEKQLALMSERAMKNAQTGVAQYFSAYDPQVILEKYYATLKSPDVVENLVPQVIDLAHSWENTSKELTVQVESMVDSVETLINTHYEEIDFKDAAKLPQNIEKIVGIISNINSAVESASKVKTGVDSTVKKLQNDVVFVKNVTNEVGNSITVDINFINNEVKKIAGFSIKDGERILTGVIDPVLYNVLGKYYPIFMQAVEHIKDFQQSQKNTAATESRKKQTIRLAGRTINFTKDNFPSFLLKTLSLDGNITESFQIAGSVHNITNNIDLWRKPLDIHLSLNRGTQSENIKAVFDFRTKRDDSNVQVYVTARGYPLSIVIPVDESIAGIPTITGTTEVNGTLKFDEETGFSLSSVLFLNPAKITIKPFAPDFLYRMYNGVLEPITSLSLDVKTAFSPANGFSFTIASDADNQIAKNVTHVMNAELEIIKNDLQLVVKEKLDEVTQSFSEQIALFNDYKMRVEESKMLVENVLTNLEQEKAKYNQMLEDAKNQATKKASDAIKNAATQQADNLFKKLF